MAEDYSKIITLFFLGLGGSFSHCIFMCSPFVFTQIGFKLEGYSQDFGFVSRLKVAGLLPYHFGRITSYCFIAGMVNIIGYSIKDNLVFKIITASILLILAMFFLLKFLENFKLTFLIKRKMHKFAELYGFDKFLAIFRQKLLKIANVQGLVNRFIYNFLLPRKSLQNLLKSNNKFANYFVGVILGFLPCGLIYMALVIVANFHNVFLAMVGMLAFGFATAPALVIAGYFGTNKFMLQYPKINNLFLLINILMLIFISYQIIY